ncbi:Piso0_000050 [Millerozyma farinosa CBS 7064]|uniref:Piso0_000050 protein n=1 Tax=Pichia sorbitophila (strain ATCC MYA-4447 / BCRC 22081 / CBS 7064 / NBRC 10061 / NRRL Y-12695) TaxID=559304 RepID=G8YUE1_PICSO|nr:Piso0_000050 [Millerozyma farinosa CBS 7064]
MYVYQEMDDVSDLDSQCDVMSELDPSHDDTALTGIKYNDIGLQEEEFKKASLAANDCLYKMYSYAFDFSVIPFDRRATALERGAEKCFSPSEAFPLYENHNKLLSNRPESNRRASCYHTGIESSYYAKDISDTFSSTLLRASPFDHFADTNAPNANIYKHAARRNDLLAPKLSRSVFCMAESVEYVNKNNQRFVRKMSDTERGFVPRKLHFDV